MLERDNWHGGNWSLPLSLYFLLLHPLWSPLVYDSRCQHLGWAGTHAALIRALPIWAWNTSSWDPVLLPETVTGFNKKHPAPCTCQLLCPPYAICSLSLHSLSFYKVSGTPSIVPWRCFSRGLNMQYLYYIIFNMQCLYYFSNIFK